MVVTLALTTNTSGIGDRRVPSPRRRGSSLSLDGGSMERSMGLEVGWIVALIVLDESISTVRCGEQRNVIRRFAAHLPLSLNDDMYNFLTDSPVLPA